MAKHSKYQFRLFFSVPIMSLILTSFTVFAKDWGLGFPTPGSKPAGNETVEFLQKYDAYFVGSGEDKVIYLTFDAGYENGYTESILDVLKKNNVPAAFFLVGTYIKSNPELINRMISEGHIICNHSTTHPDMTKLDKESFNKELSQTEQTYKSVTGSEISKYYRPPQGKYSAESLQMAKDMGYKTILWSLAYNDYNDKDQPTKDTAFSKLIPRAHPGMVLLLHSTSKTNSLLMDELIAKYREMGYEFKSLDSLK